PLLPPGGAAEPRQSGRERHPVRLSWAGIRWRRPLRDNPGPETDPAGCPGTLVSDRREKPADMAVDGRSGAGGPGTDRGLSVPRRPGALAEQARLLPDPRQLHADGR